MATRGASRLHLCRREGSVMAKIRGLLMSVWDALKRTVTGESGPPPDLEATLAELRTTTPAPVFWLLGKTQSGKTSLVRYLTGAEDAVIGSGFRPCTRTSRIYEFPTPDAPL